MKKTTYTLAPKGIVSYHTVNAPMDRGSCFFRLPDGGLHQELYLVDGRKWIPFTNGGTLPARMNKARGQQTISVVVVSERETVLNKITVIKSDIPLKFPGGKYGVLRLRCELDASIRVSDPEALARKFLNGQVSDVEVVATNILKEELTKAVNCMLRRMKRHGEAITAEVPLSSDLIAAEVVQKAQQALPWLAFSGYCALVIENATDLVQLANGARDERRARWGSMVRGVFEVIDQVIPIRKVLEKLFGIS